MYTWSNDIKVPKYIRSHGSRGEIQQTNHKRTQFWEMESMFEMLMLIKILKYKFYENVEDILLLIKILKKNQEN